VLVHTTGKEHSVVIDYLVEKGTWFCYRLTRQTSNSRINRISLSVLILQLVFYWHLAKLRYQRDFWLMSIFCDLILMSQDWKI
jgi:hypothetical protein